MADIVRDCTDTSGTAVEGEKEPWLLRKTCFIASLEHKPEASLLVTAADKAHNAFFHGTTRRGCGVSRSLVRTGCRGSKAGGCACIARGENLGSNRSEHPYVR